MWTVAVASLGKNSLPSSLLWLSARFSFSQVFGLRASVPHWLLMEAALNSLPYGPPQNESLIHQSQQEGLLAKGKSQSYITNHECVTYHFCHIIVLRDKSLGPVHVEGERMDMGVNTRREDSCGATLDISPPFDGFGRSKAK